jgi:tetratricopeptide (TPR) repeat protein
MTIVMKTNSVVPKKNTGVKKSSVIALLVTLCGATSFALPSEASFLKPKAKQELAANKKSQPAQESPATEPDTSETVLDNSMARTMPYADESVKHYNHGVELHQAGFLNQAIGEYKEAISADNRMEEAYSNLGIIYAAQHNYPKARESFEEALRLRPKRPTTLNGLGTVIYAQGQTEEAMKKWQEALSADPKFASAYYNMGNAYEGQKNFEQAKSCYLKAIEVMPNMADAYFRLGNILSKESHLPQAELLLSRSVELSPDGEFVREAKHSLSIIENRFEKNKAKNPAIHKKS